MTRVVIVDAKRTPFGRFRGSLAAESAAELAVAAAAPMIDRIDPSMIDQVILGNVLAAGQGMNVARQVAVKLGLPVRTPAWSVNMMCGSGLQAALAAATAIRAGEAKVVLAGGSESMSQTPLLVPRPAKGCSLDSAAAVDSLLSDGLQDSFTGTHMAIQAERLAGEFQITRSAQDAFALRSQRLCVAAQARGEFGDEVVRVRDLAGDEHPRPETTLDSLASLKPVFDPANGTVTAGNASGVNDGAAVVVLAEYEFAKSQGWPMLARWVDAVVVGCDPERMGLGPVGAIEALLKRTGRVWADVDTLEINEAFASQTLACLQSMGVSLEHSGADGRARFADGHEVDFNGEGGAIAIGHPLAASGARVLGHLAHKISRGRSRTSVGSLCIGGGMGIAVLLETIE
jgi:acetyl-CoA C-acetyltransferase